MTSPPTSPTHHCNNVNVNYNFNFNFKDVGYMIADAVGLPRDRMVFDTTKADGQFKKTACNKKLMGLRPDYKVGR